VVEVSEEGLGEFFEFLLPHLDEKQSRLVAGATARLVGRGGITVVARSTGMSRNTVIAGTKAFDVGEEPTGRVRAEGAGRPLAEESDPTLLADLLALIEPVTRGDPMSPLRWTLKSTRQLARALNAAGHQVSHSVIGLILRAQGYSLQSNAKVNEGAQHPDRGGQFDHINDLAAARLAAGEPVISVDCKKKELVNGTKANAGREWHPKGSPERVDVHDFPDKDIPKAIPFGVLDIGANEGWMSVGDDHDTGAFAVNAIRRWWQSLGAARYPHATRLMVTADAGGSNSYRNKLWKLELARLAAETGLTITVCHYPPGTSKWNKIEHRMFSFITKNWRGRPLTSYQVIVDLVAATTTDSGLRILAEWDQGDYPKGIEVTDEQLAAVPITRHEWHPDWNYDITPPSANEPTDNQRRK
jgi:Rhodopirellula transposase DDE domain